MEHQGRPRRRHADRDVEHLLPRGYEDSEIWHVLRWSQEFGVWANPRDPRAVGKNDGFSVDPGVTTFTITDLRNGVATGVFIRSMVGHRNNMSERDGNSSQWVRTKGVHTTPVGPSQRGAHGGERH